MYISNPDNVQLGGLFKKIKKGVKKIVKTAKKAVPIAAAIYAPQTLPLIAATKSAKKARKAQAGAVDPSLVYTPPSYVGNGAGGGYPVTALPSESSGGIGGIPPAVLYVGAAALAVLLLSRKR